MPRSVGIYGLGSIGTSIANCLMERGIGIAFAVDNDPGKAGRELASVGGPEGTGVVVSEKLDRCTAEASEVVVHSTSSRLPQVFPQIAELTDAGCNVISTCEELSYPYLKHPDLARRLDLLARRSNVTVLGTGVNPGFLLDALPAFICKGCRRVDYVEASRIVEVSLRREPLQRKIGLGMDLPQFEAKASKGLVGHVGLSESCALISEALGWNISEIRQEVAPIVADEEMQTTFFRIAKGHIRGIRQEACGISEGTRIRLILEMSVGAKNPGDCIRIRGDPPITVTIHKGLNGDLATVARVLNSIDEVLAAPPGLTTVLSLPLRSHDSSPVRAKPPKIVGSAKLL